MKTDLAQEADLQGRSADLKAVIEAEKWRLKVQLGGVLIANLIAIGLLIFASVALLAP